jgi:hypothetical protein
MHKWSKNTPLANHLSYNHQLPGGKNKHIAFFAGRKRGRDSKLKLTNGMFTTVAWSVHQKPMLNASKRKKNKLFCVIFDLCLML